MTTIKVKASKEYNVHIGAGLIENCGNIIHSLIGPCKIAIISDSNVAPLYLTQVKTSLILAGFKVVEYVFPAGERSKNVQTLAGVWEFLAQSELTRRDAIVALGGGVVGDVAGFAAATYLRGIQYVQMPTSLLACVDSSVGGKTAIDLAAGKNLAGAFNQPVTVIIDTNTLSTLPDEYVADGAAECIKYGVLGNTRILDIFEKIAKENEVLEKTVFERIRPYIDEIVTQSVSMKASVVAEDEFDTGNRMFLNLGHTIGHAIEHHSNFTLSHGRAVAIGMKMIAMAGERHGVTEPGTAHKIGLLLQGVDLPTRTDFSREDLIEAGLRDKKRAGAKITLIVPKNISSCTAKSIPVEEFGNWL